MLTVHHLQRSQSERIIWLCEELGIPYELKIYQREQGLLAPPEVKALHPMGSAPVITDGPVTLAESGAIIDYILAKYAAPYTLAVPPTASNFADYLYWLHFANANLQAAIGRNMTCSFAGITADSNPIVARMMERLDDALRLIDARLQKTGKWLAGEEFTAAEIMTVCCVTTMRLFYPFGLEEYPGILAWLARVGERPAYKRTIEKGEAGETRGRVPVLGAEAPPFITTKL
ncbi:putative glutathione S-transferase [Saccharata proteae CBS 121410]|uniref:glutathione transferase n=1 Tax=Saccharata proteae CBS 121410 TaxID=1314787 RepID=A0A9P4I2L4_9PEZI|nr:putative glutathione S-transferase [Saccharata proteae CBS 121410]